MKTTKKIQGSVMGIVLTISLLITLLSSLFILKSGIDSKTAYIYQTNDRLINNAESGLQLLMSSQNLIEPNASVTLDLFDEGSDSVYLERKSWGAFEIVISKAFHGKRSIIKKAMLTSKNTDSIPLSLYVCDYGKTISVCGNTKLNGKCYVPQAGFKRAYIEGQNYSGDKYVYGTQLNSKRDLPPLNKEFISSIQMQLNKPIQSGDSVVNISGMRLPDTIRQGFDKKTLVLESTSVLGLSNIVLDGNIKLIAPVIRVSSNVYFSSIVAFGKKIELDENAQGNGQFFATESIIIGKKSSLSYPSVLGIVVKEISEANLQNPQLVIGEECSIIGDVFCISEKSNAQDEPWISLDKKTKITGNVYVNGKLDAKGSIYGSTYCQRFYLKTNSGVYENHLLNAEFDAGKLPKHYTGAPLLHQGSRKEVLLWL